MTPSLHAYIDPESEATLRRVLCVVKDYQHMDDAYMPLALDGAVS